MNIPKGFKLVPVEPTDDMVIAFAETWYSKRQAYDDPDMDDAYRDMLTAAPTPPQAVKTVTMANVMRACEYACDHPHKYLRGTSNWCAAVAWKLNQLESPAPATPQPIYDEAKVLESCRSSWEKTGVGVVFADYWQGWLACAQSRAKAGEDE